MKMLSVVGKLLVVVVGGLSRAAGGPRPGAGNSSSGD